MFFINYSTFADKNNYPAIARNWWARMVALLLSNAMLLVTAQCNSCFAASNHKRCPALQLLQLLLSLAVARNYLQKVLLIAIII